VIDVKVISIKDILQVTEVGFVPNFLPRTLDIRGLLFLQADEVQINDLPAPEFVISSDTRILAQVPDSQVASKINRVTVFATKASPDRRSFLRFEMGVTLSSQTGLQKLIQLFVKVLLQTPGSDRFHPDDGGGVLSLVGRTVSKSDSTSLQAALVGAVNRTRDQIISRQSLIRRLPSDETLLRADIQAAGFNPTTSTLAARISVGAVSGREAVANLTF